MPLVDHRTREGGVEIVWRLPRPPAATWAHLVSAETLPEWLGTVVSGAGAVGGHLVIDHGGETSTSTVMACEPPRLLGLTWEFGDEPTSQLRLALDGDGDGDGDTLLRLHHEGLGGLAGDYLAGWVTHLVHLEASLLGTPLPAGAFWPLHATVDRLLDGR